MNGAILKTRRLWKFLILPVARLLLRSVLLKKTKSTAQYGLRDKLLKEANGLSCSLPKERSYYTNSAILSTSIREILSQLESLDNGKPLSVARAADVALSAEHFRYFAGWVGKFWRYY